jgi:predicted PurR-regulated permease PerM
MATARKALIVTAVGLGVVVVALALWKIRVVVALIFIAVTISAAMRPGVEALQARRVPPPAGVLLQYLALLGVVALLLWLIVPQAVSQVEQAVGGTGTHTQL